MTTLLFLGLIWNLPQTSRATSDDAALADNASASPAGQADVSFAAVADWDGPCGCERTCGCDDCCCEECCPVWTIKAGAVILQRASPQSLVLLRNDTTGEPLANANNFKFAWEGGPDISISRRLDSMNTLEVRYFGIQDWAARQAIDIGQDVDGVFVIDASADYRSQLHSTEVNWRHQSSDDIQWLLGFRWVETYERLAIEANTIDPLIPFPVVVGLPFGTFNHLYGGQIGAEAKLWDRPRWRVDGLIKAGLFGNSARSEYGLEFFGVPLAPFIHVDGTRAAFLGEIALTAVYRLTDHFLLRAGYQLIWIESAALPEDQLAGFLVDDSGIDLGGGLFYQGALVGADLTW